VGIVETGRAESVAPIQGRFDAASAAGLAPEYEGFSHDPVEETVNPKNVEGV